LGLKDAAANLPPRGIPAEWLYRQEGDQIVTGPIEPVKADTDLLTMWGYDPAEVEIVGNISQWRKQQPDGSWRVSYRFSHRAKVDSIDLPALYAAAARKRPQVKSSVTNSGRTTVVALADVQAGKTGSRGGTPELIERLKEKRDALALHLTKVKPGRTVLADVNDLFEGFESGGNPMFTNDLSLAQQMDLASVEVFEFVSLMSRFGPVDVMAVPSNHTAWRNGKQNLGRPGDDLGLLCHRQVERLAKASGIDATWTFPPMYDESVTLDVRGTVLGLVHGNQFGPGRAADWWGKQTHGGQPIGAADILLSGHYHHLRIEPTGRNPYTARSKWWLQAPTLDNGSDWFRNLTGDDSDPGLLVFDIDEAGFNLQSLTVL
jgi:hypothetical protein